MFPSDLERWVDVLIESFASETVGGWLLRLSRPDDGADDELEFGVLPIEGHPSDFLAGFRAPASWLALGVAGGGWLGPIGRLRPSAHPEGRRIFHVVMVDRDGHVAGRVRLPDGSIMTEPPGYGAILDSLRVALGLSYAA